MFLLYLFNLLLKQCYFLISANNKDFTILSFLILIGFTLGSKNCKQAFGIHIRLTCCDTTSCSCWEPLQSDGIKTKRQTKVGRNSPTAK